MSGVNRTPEDVDIDLIRLFRAIWERKGRVLAVTAVAAGLAFVGANMLDAQYTAETRLLIEPRALALDGGAAAASAGSLPDELAVSSQVQLLQSADLIKQVARDMKLFELEEFDPEGQPSALGSLLVLVGVKKNPLELAPEERVLKAFREKLLVYQAQASRVVAIEFTSRDPKLAAAIPNKMAEVYLSLQSGAKLDTNSETARWLEPEIANLREKVREAEQKVAAYRASAGLLPTSETGTLATQQLNEVSAELARVRGERATAEARAENVRAALAAGRDAANLGDVVASPVIQRLKEQEASIQSQISDLSTSLLEGHPRLKGLRGQLAGLREQIRAETGRVLASLENEANVMGLRERQLDRQLNMMKAESARAGEEEVGLKALEREAAAQRQLLETYLARYREAASRLDPTSAPADARVISRAVEPREAAFPKVVPITVVAAVSAFTLMSIVIMLAELFSGRALRPAAREEEAAASPAASPAAMAESPARRPAGPASLLSAAAADPVLVDEMTEAFEGDGLAPDGAAGEEFSLASVAAQVASDRFSGMPLVAVSPSGDDGSAATVALARTLADAGRRVLLIDLTGSAVPSLAMAERADLPGITDILTGQAAFGEIIHPDRMSRAHVVPHGTADAGQAMRAAERLPMILGALAEAYERVIVECGPADAADVARLTRGGRAAILFSLPDLVEAELEELFAAFDEAGFADFLLLSDREAGRPGEGRREAA